MKPGMKVPKRQKINEDNFALIKQLLAQGCKGVQIQSMFGISNATLSHIKRSETVDEYHESVVARRNAYIKNKNASTNGNTQNEVQEEKPTEARRSDVFAISEMDLMKVLESLQEQNEKLMQEFITMKLEMSEILCESRQKRGLFHR